MHERSKLETLLNALDASRNSAAGPSAALMAAPSTGADSVLTIGGAPPMRH